MNKEFNICGSQLKNPKQHSRSKKNCNPGNLKYANQKGTIGKDDKNFAIFPNYQIGFDALIHQLEIAANGQSKIYKPKDTILNFFQKFAPIVDKNNPIEYAKFVVNEVGLNSINDKLEDILLTEFDWAKKYNNAESIIYPTPVSEEKKNEIEKFNYIAYIFKKLWSLIFKDNQ